jgi:glycosyltransferase involved in cell wall biosynthesis
MIYEIDWNLVAFISLCSVIGIQAFYYLFFFIRLALYKSKQVQNTQTHPLSVIICARDEADNLIKNLPGVLVQHFSTTHEVIVVNDNSFDESRYILDELKKTFRNLIPVELSQEAKLIMGKKFPLSIGIKSAKYETLILTDADCVPASEFWMQKMHDAYTENVEVVLGYGAYHKRKGLLNKIIRFETFHSALQYLSYALAGIPYMGVGRNLSYKRSLFFKTKGFSSMNQIPGGDDDLFINKVATKKNTAIVIDKDSHTLSQPKKKWGEWFKQKTRHYSTAKYYKPLHKFLLGLYSFSQFLVYPLLAVSIIFYCWWLALSCFWFSFFITSHYLV